MPKRKGKLRGTLPPDVTSSLTKQPLISSCVVPGTPLLEAGRSPGQASDASLSPTGPSPPPKPVAQVGNLQLNADTEVLRSSDWGRQAMAGKATIPPSSAEGTSKELAKVGAEGSPVPAREDDRGISVNLQLTALEIPPLQKPAEYTLESIWLALESLHKICGTIVTAITNNAGEVREMQMVSKDHEIRIKDLETKSTDCSTFQAEVVKDNVLLLRKIENLENASRVLNLRFLNFPYSKLKTPKDMLYKFLKEILGYQEANLPLLNKVYYLPSVYQQQDSKVTSAPLDVSALLEQSQEEGVDNRGTLIASFVFNTDKELLLKTYFKKSGVEFLSEYVRIFPDVSRWTQDRRKKFLALRPQVTALGAKFMLKFPCKCHVSYKNSLYVFFDPDQLNNFLASSDRESSTPS